MTAKFEKETTQAQIVKMASPQNLQQAVRYLVPLALMTESKLLTQRQNLISKIIDI
ncbi:hypothetical protein [Flavobacterium caeni]|uniref:hypothetical protein n=1 Tax=Flavobacterium caeni TaxID=490189 RepID=UPI00147CE7E2|nr:hypothetical protein [Flavobacterium caeni]